MALQVCNGAMLKCSMGLAPSSMIVTPEMGGIIEVQNPGQQTHQIP